MAQKVNQETVMIDNHGYNKHILFFRRPSLPDFLDPCTIYTPSNLPLINKIPNIERKKNQDKRHTARPVRS